MKRFAIVISIAALVGATVVALGTGATAIDNFWSAIISPGSNEILWNIRVPRVLAAIVVGAALGVAGLMAQGACNNPLAEPSILGTSAGASLATVAAIVLGIFEVGSIGAIVCGVVGAFLATVATFTVAAKGKGLTSFSLIIVGIAVSTGLSALVGLATSMTSRADARSISFWNFGSLALVTADSVVALTIFTAVGLSLAFKVAPALDRLSLGDSTATHLGVDVKGVRRTALLALSLLAGVTVSTVGTIAFLGLAAPHIARFIYGPLHRQLVIHSALIGALIVVVADTLARTIAAPNELPIGLVTSLIGAPVLIALVTVKSNVWRTQ